MHRFLAGCALALLAPSADAAPVDAGEPIEQGRQYRFESAVLGEARRILVSLPGGYDDAPGRRYPVVVVLDGDFEHDFAAAMTRFYAAVSELPAMIVVGVCHEDRMRDLTPAPVDGFTPPPGAPAGGGADDFLVFLADELLPYLDSAYRMEPLRVLVGHSLGGLFALHALATRPDAFLGYLVMEPSVWWNGQHELRAAEAMLRTPAARRARVILVNTPPLAADTTHWGGTAPMVRMLATEGESHAGMAAAGMMAGLRAMFADFRTPKWVPGTRPIAMLSQFDVLAERLGYAVPVPEGVFRMAFRMSVDSRHFEDAGEILDRMEADLGASPDTRALRTKLATERATPVPADFIPLEFPAAKPAPREAAAFLGRWTSVDPARPHEVEFRAVADTIAVRDHVANENGPPFEGDGPVIRVTEDGVLEWGLPVLRGLAALLVQRGRLLEDGTMEVTKEVRGFSPRGPVDDMVRAERLRRAEAATAP